MAPEPSKRPLTPRQVAELFNVHPVTVADWADKGKLRGFRTPGGHWRFKREDVDALIAAGQPESAAS